MDEARSGEPLFASSLVRASAHEGGTPVVSLSSIERDDLDHPHRLGGLFSRVVSWGGSPIGLSRDVQCQRFRCEVSLAYADAA